MKVLTLMSGGLDSTTLAASLQHEGHKVAGLWAGYGAQHEAQEHKAAMQVSSRLKITLYTVDIPTIVFAESGSALLGYSEIPDGEYEPLTESHGPSSTVVPFRNGILLALATAMANSRGFDAIALAVHINDHHNWAYPDCSPEFTGAMSAAIYVGTHHKVRLLTPFVWLSKAHIVTIAAQVHAPVEKTYSCYRGDAVPCGACPTCIERIRAFRKAGYIDPTDYKHPDKIFWDDCQPWQYSIA